MYSEATVAAVIAALLAAAACGEKSTELQILSYSSI